MIYNCRECGGWFGTEQLNKAMAQNQNFITCVYCGKPNEFRDVKSSHIVKGFDFLSVGEFYMASLEFSIAIDDAKRTSHNPSPDAYLGFALSQFRVQSISSDEDKTADPLIICHHCNEEFFADNENYNNALFCKEDDLRPDLIETVASERRKLENYAKTIDTIKDYYDEIKASKKDKFKYSVFIAYEDNPLDEESKRGYEVAIKVRNNMPDSLRKNVFFPDFSDSEFMGDRLRYEAAILYAIDNSNCMLVIADNNIDSRLVSMYTRFYQNGGDENTLGFIRFLNAITINLPDRRVANHVCDATNVDTYVSFACKCNNVIWVPTEKINDEKKVTIGKWDLYEESDDENDLPYKREGKQFFFGSYPQKLETRKEVVNYFAELERPTADELNGWTVMFTNKVMGRPYTWYRDETISVEVRNEKGERKKELRKYRGVLFKQNREVFSVQEPERKSMEQLSNNYKKGQIYCFEFSPIVWNVVDLSKGIAVLTTNRGIDSREYNDTEMLNDWEGSSIRKWLNEDFLNSAFSEKEREQLCTMLGYDEEDKVFLLTKKFDLPKYFSSNISNPDGTDYFKCLGGMCDRSINSYWVQAEESNGDYDDDYDKAPVVYSSENNRHSFATQFVDNTSVAVMPKILLKLK